MADIRRGATRRIEDWKLATGILNARTATSTDSTSRAKS
jgi:hypothetical protein